MWSIAAERSTPETSNAMDGSSMESLLAYSARLPVLRRVIAMRSDAILASKGARPDDHPTCGRVVHRGPVLSDRDEPERAERLLVRGSRRGRRNRICFVGGDDPGGAGPGCCCSQLLRRPTNWVSKRTISSATERSTSTRPVLRCSLFQARLAIDSGRIDLALNSNSARAARLRPLLTYELPVISVITLLDMARCYLALTTGPPRSTS